MNLREAKTGGSIGVKDPETGEWLYFNENEFVDYLDDPAKKDVLIGAITKDQDEEGYLTGKEWGDAFEGKMTKDEIEKKMKANYKKRLEGTYEGLLPVKTAPGELDKPTPKADISMPRSSEQDELPGEQEDLPEKPLTEKERALQELRGAAKPEPSYVPPGRKPEAQQLASVDFVSNRQAFHDHLVTNLGVDPTIKNTPRKVNIFMRENEKAIFDDLFPTEAYSTREFMSEDKKKIWREALSRARRDAEDMFEDQREEALSIYNAEMNKFDRYQKELMARQKEINSAVEKQRKELKATKKEKGSKLYKLKNQRLKLLEKRQTAFDPTLKQEIEKRIKEIEREITKLDKRPKAEHLAIVATLRDKWTAEGVPQAVQDERIRKLESGR